MKRFGIETSGDSLIGMRVSKIAGLIFFAVLSFGCFADGVNAGQLDMVKAKLDEKFQKVIGSACKWNSSYHHHAIADIKKNNNEIYVEGDVTYTCYARDNTGRDVRLTQAFRANLKQILDDYEVVSIQISEDNFKTRIMLFPKEFK